MMNYNTSQKPQKILCYWRRILTVAKQSQRKELSSCIHKCCFVGKKHTDKGLTLNLWARNIVCISRHIPTREQDKWRTISEETLKQDLVCCSFKGEWEVMWLSFLSVMKRSHVQWHPIFPFDNFKKKNFYFLIEFGWQSFQWSIDNSETWLAKYRLHLSINLLLLTA